MDKQKSKKTKLTSNASLVLKALQQDQRPYSAYELIDRLRSAGVKAPATVYRALERLIASGSVHRLESLNAYVACTHGHCQENVSVAFAICDDCGSVDELADTSVANAAVDWARKHTFALSATTLELRGTCGACRVSGDSDTARS